MAPCAADEDAAKFCAWLREVVAQNHRALKTQTAARLKGHMDSYWYQVHLFYQQLEGIEFGWRYGLKRSPMKRSGLELPIVDLLILNLGADLQLLQDHYNHAVLAPDAPKVQFAGRQRQAIRLDLEQDAEQRISLTLDHNLHG